MTKQTPQKKNADGRYESTNYRYSNEFIQKVTRWLIAAIFIGVGSGFLLGIVGFAVYPDGEPEWFKITAYGLMGAGIILPLVIGGWLGGQALHRFGGIAGLFLTLGVIGVATANMIGLGLWFWLGVGALVIGIIWIFYLGIQAKVPIWLQLPILESPRLYITRGEAGKKKSKK